MRKGTNKLATQIGNKGYFASISIEITMSTTNTFIEYSNIDFKKWSNSIEFGLDYFEEQFMKYNKKKLEEIIINITELEYQIVDTTPIIITFVFIKALCDVFDLPQNFHPVFDNEMGKFIFDK